MDVHESQIEDIFANSPDLVKKILAIEDEPKLLARQLQVSSGRLDLLFSHKSQLLLIELKVTPFQDKHITQVINYKKNLVDLQHKEMLLKADIITYLLCTQASSNQINKSILKGVKCVQYRPEFILQYYYLSSRPIAALSEIKPVDVGIWNLHLINKFIYLVKDQCRIDKLLSKIGGSRKSLYNKIRFASLLNLILWKPNSNIVTLSDLGKKYIIATDKPLQMRLNDEQIILLKNYIAKNPYGSSVILGIASIVESVYYLAKNLYPVKMQDLCSYFAMHSGKQLEWKTDKAKYNASRMYSNYAVDLGLLAKSDNELFITPEGFKFVATMQLHKGIRVIESLR